MGRPDLEEFLSALSGFVDRKSASPDTSYLKFLDIFCRSVGSTEGHLLRTGARGLLESVSSFGVDNRFDADFNASRTQENSPIDEAFSKGRVVALVEIQSRDVPRWFFDLMTRYSYKALVAVPIIGTAGPTGVICAYYRDVCLFDQGTLDRLASVGRMLGGAEESSEKPVAARAPAPTVPGAVPAGRPQATASDDAFDGFAGTLTGQSFTKIQVFEHLVETVEKAFPGAEVICGPVRMVSGEMVMTVADAAGVPSATVSQRLTLPAALREALGSGQGLVSLATGQQGALKPLMKTAQATAMARALLFQGKLQAAVIVWRGAATPFTADDERRLGRFAAIAALALNAV